MSQCCGNCRHWGEDEEREDNETHRTCCAVPHADRGTQTQYLDPKRYKGDEDYIDGILSSPACVTDGSGYAAALMTREEFGCTLWEAR
jgi:hypothetical protein